MYTRFPIYIFALLVLHGLSTAWDAGPEFFEKFPSVRSLIRQQKAPPISQTTRHLSEVDKWWGPIESRALIKRDGVISINPAAHTVLKSRGYRVVETLGSGSFGAVYAVFKKGKMYAAKVALSGKAVPDLLKEYQVYVYLGPHPNLLRIYSDVEFTYDGHDERTGHLVTKRGAVMVMGYSERRDLGSYMKGKDLRSLYKLHIMQGVTAGLRYVKSRGYHHLDLKPANIIVPSGQEDDFKVSDFGCAQRGSYGYPFGDRKYMAPEGILHGNKQQDLEKLDVFALGITFYQILKDTRRPFGTSETEIVNGASRKTWRQGLKVEKAADRWDRLFSLMLDPNPVTRTTLDDVARRLEEIKKIVAASH